MITAYHWRDRCAIAKVASRETSPQPGAVPAKMSAKMMEDASDAQTVDPGGGLLKFFIGEDPVQRCMQHPQLRGT